MKEFINSITKNLEANGFPKKCVAFPLEKMYEVADNKGLNFNQIRELLKEDGTISEVEGDRIIFKKEDTSSNFEDAINTLSGDSSLMQKAEEMMKNMSPEQLAEIQDKVSKMSSEEREELMKKGREMGFI